MHEYEIRVLSRGQIILITSQVQLSDNAAIRSARKIGADRPFEVWEACLSTMLFAGPRRIGAA
jgi:hypothetical protein